MQGINFQYTGVHAHDAMLHLVVGWDGCTWSNNKIRLQSNHKCGLQLENIITIIIIKKWQKFKNDNNNEIKKKNNNRNNKNNDDIIRV